MIEESLILMLIGMGIVFGFLVLLVVLLRLMSAFASWVAPADWHDAPASAALVGERAVPTDTELIAVLSAAVARYRSRSPG